MARKKKIIRDLGPGVPSDNKAKTPEVEPEKTRLPERIREKDSGFGVIKAVVGGIVILILASTVLFNMVGGGRGSVRGEKSLGEPCEETVECKKGSICYVYGEKPKQCMAACSDNKCREGYSCVTAASQKPRKGTRITDICVRDADQ